MANLVCKENEGRSFNFEEDKISIKVCARDTNGAYSLMHWTVAPRTGDDLGHVHERYEESFYVLSGNLDFILGNESIPIARGDFVRVPAGMRHGFQNKTDVAVELFVGFTPGGMEELFYQYRNEVGEFDAEAYKKDAKTLHGTEYET